MSALRKLLWGQFDAQWADFRVSQIVGRSVIVDGGASNIDSATVYDPAVLPWLYSSGDSGNTFARSLFKINMATLRAMLGMTPVLVRVRWWWWRATGNTASRNYALRRVLPGRLPDWPDCDARYRDVSAALAWGDDAGAYAPVWDYDVLSAAFASVTTQYAAGAATAYSDFINITTELGFAIQSGGDLCCMMYDLELANKLSQLSVSFYWATPGQRPYLEIMYLFPLEFFGCKPSGAIDMTQLLNNALDTGQGNLNLGAGEKGQTLTPVAARVKNFSARTLPLVEVLDDSPEWTPPIADSGNSGNAALAYPTLLDTAVSQKWWIKFTSASAFQVKATKYKDYQADLNPNYGGAGWTGTIGSDWSSPTGGVTIPAAAWSGTPVANDFFTFYVTGQTTDPAWPADSNTQVQMTKDSAGSPDAANWRPVKGQRTTTTGSTTIDSTTKTINVQHIDTSKWPTNNKVFIGDYSNIDEGYVSSCTASSITVVFPSASGHVYAAGTRVCTSLPVGSISPGVWGLTTGAAGASQSNPALIPLVGAAALGFTNGATIVIQDPGDPTITEEATISTVATDSILCTAYLTKDYAQGAMVMMGGSGEAKFWLKVVSNAGTNEELKRLRLVTRT
jgi:hypothetical protein